MEAEASAFHGVAHADAVVLDEQPEVVALAREVHENHAGFPVGECVFERVGDQLVDDETERHGCRQRDVVALGSALYGDAAARARLQILAQLRNEELAVEIAIVGAGVQPIAQPRDDMHQLARLLEGELDLGILGRIGPQPYQRIEGGKVVGDAMRHLAQLQRLRAALVREPHRGVGEAN